jgi:small subunit ribosomal protein S15
MATKYGRGRGKARSHPPKAEKASWIKEDAKEVEALVVKLAKEGLDTAKIGLTLRDSNGINNVKAITGKKINQILEAHNIQKEPQDLISLQERIKALKKHFEKNKKDKKAKRGLQLTEAKLRKLNQYFEKKK